jgi:hypothetical protein
VKVPLANQCTLRRSNPRELVSSRPRALPLSILIHHNQLNRTSCDPEPIHSGPKSVKFGERISGSAE